MGKGDSAQDNAIMWDIAYYTHDNGPSPGTICKQGKLIRDLLASPVRTECKRASGAKRLVGQQMVVALIQVQ